MIKSITDDQITQKQGCLSVNWVKESAGFDIFSYQNKSRSQVEIGDEADYLLLCMRIAERIYLQQDKEFGTYLVASDTGGKQLFFKTFSSEEKQQFKYSYICLLNAAKKLTADDISGEFNFFGEINLVKASEKKFEKEAKKVARILKGSNKETWIDIVENGSDFLKTDLYVFFLQKLYSWGFQPIGPDGKPTDEPNLVRAVFPAARGSSRR